ncbi:MAG: type II toxin-antitoxin system HigB family toxin [Methylococcales bacterium]|nr:type II toxin-antitoxin system HigB family toxin [Methylococcales bacterium]
MHIISKKPFSAASTKYPNDRDAIMNIYNVLRKAEFDTPNIMKETFTSLDNFKYKDKWWVIDIGGNNLRLIAAILFSSQKMYVKHIVTHAEYDKLCIQYRKGAH